MSKIVQFCNISAAILSLRIINNLNVQFLFFLKSFIKFTQLYFIKSASIYARKCFSWKKNGKYLVIENSYRKELRVIFFKLFQIVARYNDLQIIPLTSDLQKKSEKICIYFYKYSSLINKTYSYNKKYTVMIK